MTTDLRAKYGDSAYEEGLKQQPRTFERRLAERDDLDQHFTRLWLDFAITGMGRRQVLDTRTRLLVLTGQFTMSKSWEMLEDNIYAAIAAGVNPREVLEIILQCAVYGGQTTADPAIRIFHRVAKEEGLIDELRKSQKPMDNNDSQRNYEEERKTWHADDVADPRYEPLMKRHGCAKAITTDGLRSDKAAMTELNVAVRQEIGRWANNRAAALAEWRELAA